MRVLMGILSFVTAVLCTHPSSAQDWPTRYVTMIVPFGAGSATDVVARIVAAEMSQHLGQQIVIDNVGGAGGTIGVERAARAAPDGYHIVLSAVDTFAQARFLYAQLKYDSVKDFAPVALVAEQPLLLTVRSTLPTSDAREFVEYLRKNHQKMQFGSGGIGAGPYLACALINMAVRVDVTHVAYRGSAPALQDMAAGTLDYYCPLAPAALGLMSNNSIKALAVLTENRSELLPDLPTAKEQGLPVTAGYSWFAIFAPRGTPEPVLQKLNSAARAALASPKTQERLRAAGSLAVSAQRQSREYLASYLSEEIQKWGSVMKEAGIQPR